MNKNITTLWIWVMCIACTTLMTGCESTFVDPCKELTTQRILRFREYCYDADGNIKLSRQIGDSETEWTITIKTDTEVCTIFHRLTGLQIHPSEKHEYSYHSEDHRFICRMVRNTATNNNRYASLYLWIEGCPEIEAIYFVRKQTNHQYASNRTLHQTNP